MSRANLPAVTLNHGDTIAVNIEVFMISLEGGLFTVNAITKGVRVKRDGETKYRALPHVDAEEAGK